jgi:hypothetical protein
MQFQPQTSPCKVVDGLPRSTSLTRCCISFHEQLHATIAFKTTTIIITTTTTITTTTKKTNGCYCCCYCCCLVESSWIISRAVFCERLHRSATYGCVQKCLFPERYNNNGKNNNKNVTISCFPYIRYIWTLPYSRVHYFTIVNSTNNNRNSTKR